MDLVIQKPATESFLPQVYTWRDLLIDLGDQVGVRASGLDDRRLRGATIDAMRDLCNKRDWNFLLNIAKFRTTARTECAGYYDHTGGSAERLVTLTTGSVPSNIRDYLVVIDNIPYEPDESLSSSTLTLSNRNNPGADIDSVGTPGDIVFVRVYYQCPSNFIKGVEPEGGNGVGVIGWASPEEFHAFLMRRSPQYGDPRGVAAVPHPRMIGQRALAVFPYASTARVISMMYRATARPMRISGLASGHVGTFTLNTGTDANRATLTGITVTESLVGAIFRVRSDSNTPENIDGQYPFDDQFSIIDVDTGNSCVYLDRDSTVSYTAKKCVVSDPVDIPQYALTALKAGCRYYHAMASSKDRKDVMMLYETYKAELIQLCETDNGVIAGTFGAGGINFQDDSDMSRDWSA